MHAVTRQVRTASPIAWAIATLTMALGACGGDTTAPPATATTLAFSTQPGGAVAGAALSPAPVVEFRSAEGTRVPVTGSVTLSLGANAAGASLAGTVTVAAVNGAVTFSGISVSRAGAGYTLVASAAGVTSATSAPFDVTAGTHLVFGTQPSSGTGGLPLAAQPVVEVRDAGGALVTTPITVTLALVGGTGATLGGVTTAVTAGGTATFTGLLVDRATTGYTLHATAPGAADAESSPFAISVGPASGMSLITSARTALLAGETTTLTIQARDEGRNNLTVGGATVVVGTSGDPGTSGLAFGPVIDNGNGTYSATVRGASPGTPRFVFGGMNGTNIATVLPAIGVTAFTAVSAGWKHTCAVSADGQLLCWGDNSSGQLGGAAAGGAPVVLPGNSWTRVSAGFKHTCAIAAAGAASCWGNDDYGQLGRGTSGSAIDPPAAVSGGFAFLDIETSLGIPVPGLSEEGFSTCGITTGGAALCWGDSRLGQVGNGSKTEVALPAAAGLSSVGSIGIGPEHACAIAVTTRYCWGSNNGGLLGNGGSLTGETCGGVSCRSTPLALDGGYTAGSLTVGVRHSCALAGGSAYCWGSSGSSPTAVPGVSFTRISAGDEFTCGISNGSAYCWGTNGAGQLGIGSQSAQATPQQISTVGLTAVDAGGSHACGLTASGVIYCWGANSSGQLGDGTTTMRLTPVELTFHR